MKIEFFKKKEKPVVTVVSVEEKRRQEEKEKKEREEREREKRELMIYSVARGAALILAEEEIPGEVTFKIARNDGEYNNEIREKADREDKIKDKAEKYVGGLVKFIYLMDKEKVGTGFFNTILSQQDPSTALLYSYKEEKKRLEEQTS